MDVTKTLEQRGGRYGTFEANAKITQLLMRVLSTGTNFELLSDVHKEAYHMILHKIGRSVNGDPWYDDNMHDVIGYANLLEDFIKEHNANQS
jgi:hypothetical protein